VDDETDELVIVVEERGANALHSNRGAHPLFRSADVILYLNHQPVSFDSQGEPEAAAVVLIGRNFERGTHCSVELHPFRVLRGGSHLIEGRMARRRHGRFSENAPPGRRDVGGEVGLSCNSFQI
jgi:hypothetical protein